MQINVVTQSVKRRLIIETATRFLRKELKLEKSTYALTIYNAPGLRKREGFNGIVSKTSERELTMIVDGGLNEVDLIQCVAHEMVHTKQMAKGQLQFFNSKHTLWCGQQVSKRTAYHERPWEQEAFARERLLAARALAYCEKEMVKRVNKLLKNV